MTKRVDIRELVQNSSILRKYDYVEVEDKKTHKLRGIFISSELADEFKEFIEEKKQKEIQEKLDALNSIVPLPPGTLVDKTIQSIKSDMEVYIS